MYKWISSYHFYLTLYWGASGCCLTGVWMSTILFKKNFRNSIDLTSLGLSCHYKRVHGGPSQNGICKKFIDFQEITKECQGPKPYVPPITYESENENDVTNRGVWVDIKQWK